MYSAINSQLGCSRLFLQVIVCIIMSGFDAVATVRHITVGAATELNPAMNYFINKDFILFFWIKICLTAIGLVTCYIFSRYLIARQALRFFTVVYIILTAYHYVIYQIH